MKGKTYVVSTISIVLVMLIAVGAFTVAIDPLFQYHKPWFGMKPVIESERYHNAGLAKTFDYDNYIIGNSMCKNFVPVDANEAFGGRTARISANGSLPIDWSYLLDIFSKKQYPVKTILVNIDPFIFEASPTEFRHELPVYLYDDNYLNDVNYLYNFSIMYEYTSSSIKNNMLNSIPDYDTLLPDEDSLENYSKANVLRDYERVQISEPDCSTKDYIDNLDKNLNLLIPYILKMPDTTFVLFCSPFSMLYWDEQTRNGKVEALKNAFLHTCETLTQIQNVDLYLWEDDEMLEVMSNLDNYSDHAHYSPKINKEILRRIGKGYGKVSDTNYQDKVKKLFDYIESFNYDILFE